MKGPRHTEKFPLIQSRLHHPALSTLLMSIMKNCPPAKTIMETVHTPVTLHTLWPLDTLETWVQVKTGRVPTPLAMSITRKYSVDIPLSRPRTHLRILVPIHTLHTTNPLGTTATIDTKGTTAWDMMTTPLAMVFTTQHSVCILLLRLPTPYPLDPLRVRPQAPPYQRRLPSLPCQLIWQLPGPNPLISAIPQLSSQVQ